MLRSARRTVVELDGLMYQLHENRLEPLVDLEEIEGTHWLISDLQTAVPHRMLLEGQIKYAELMVRKQLQESGEFDELVTVITHWKKKKKRDTTDICYTAVPARLYHQYLDQGSAAENVQLLFPVYAVLCRLLRHLRPREPVAIAFHHSRFVDLVIGTKDQIYYANPCVAFDASEEQTEALWNTVRSDIQTVEAENRVSVSRLIYLNWIDTPDPPVWPAEDNTAFSPYEAREYSVSGEPCNISFLNAAEKLIVADSISPPLVKTSYYSRILAPFCNIILLLAVLASIAGALYMERESGAMKSRIAAIEGSISEIRKGILETKPAKAYEEMFGFVKTLAFSYSAPSYRTVINDISVALAPIAANDLHLDELKIDYGEDAVSIDMSGSITAVFDSAHYGFRRFLDTMGRKGFQIDRSTFDTEINTSHFSITLSKRI